MSSTRYDRPSMLAIHALRVVSRTSKSQANRLRLHQTSGDHGCYSQLSPQWHLQRPKRRKRESDKIEITNDINNPLPQDKSTCRRALWRCQSTQVCELRVAICGLTEYNEQDHCHKVKDACQNHAGVSAVSEPFE